jgi:hypothetical protein
VNELSNTDVVQASTEDAALQSPADFLREHQGVCVRAAELREANTSAPVVTQAVAEGVTSGLQAAAGPVAPQDLVSGAAEAAIHAEVPAPAAAPEVVQAAAPVAAEPEASEVIPASSPAQGTPTFSGSLGNPAASAFVGSDGAPVLTTEPAPAQLKKR